MINQIETEIEIERIDHAERAWRKELRNQVRLALFDSVSEGDPQHAHRLQRRTVEKQVGFLSERSTRCATDSAACRFAGIARSTLGEWLKSPKFAELYGAAVEEFNDGLEEEVRRRAVDGTDRPVFYKGRPCGAVREYSDQLLMFLLKARRPKIFRENHNINIGATSLEDIVAGGFILQGGVAVRALPAAPNASADDVGGSALRDGGLHTCGDRKTTEFQEEGSTAT